jgi:iron(III) transport system substrate-binding protein
MSSALTIYSGRNRPDLTPAYRLFEQLTGTTVRVEKVYHHNVGERILSERNEPRADLLLTNSQLAIEALRPHGVFDPYEASVARAYDAWLRAEDYSWLSFTAWPRVAMINRAVLGDDPARWPQGLDDLADPRFRDVVACASLVEMTTVAFFAALRVAQGDAATEERLRRLRANGLRVYQSNLFTREALMKEPLAAALVNSSNAHVFHLEGNPVAEAWLDQGENELGTHVEAHTVAVLAGCQHPEAARDFIDFLLSVEVQDLLARLYGETPVNPAADTPWVKPLGAIRRMEAPLERLAALVPSTTELLRANGFAVQAE